jgi:hypothetical protein
MPALNPMVCPSPQEVLRSAASSSSRMASASRWYSSAPAFR